MAVLILKIMIASLEYLTPLNSNVHSEAHSINIIYKIQT